MGFKKRARDRKSTKTTKKPSEIYLFHRKNSEKKDSLWKEINELSIIAKEEISYYNLFSESPPKMPKIYKFCDTIISKNEFGEVQGYLIYIPWENVPIIVDQIFEPPLNTQHMYVEWTLKWLDYWATSYDCDYLSSEQWLRWNILCQIYVKKPFRKNGIAKKMFEEYLRISSEIEECV